MLLEPVHMCSRSSVTHFVHNLLYATQGYHFKLKQSVSNRKRCFTRRGAMEQLTVKSLTGKTTTVDIEPGEKLLITPSKVTVRSATGKTTVVDVDSGDTVNVVIKPAKVTRLAAFQADEEIAERLTHMTECYRDAMKRLAVEDAPNPDIGARLHQAATRDDYYQSPDIPARCNQAAGRDEYYQNHPDAASSHNAARRDGYYQNRDIPASSHKAARRDEYYQNHDDAASSHNAARRDEYYQDLDIPARCHKAARRDEHHARRDEYFQQ